MDGKESSATEEQPCIGPSDFDVLNIVGKGFFGKVVRARKKDNGRIYAMKVRSYNSIHIRLRRSQFIPGSSSS